MMAQDRAAARDADTSRADQQFISERVASVGAMSHQSNRGYQATPQAFVRLTGSHLVKPRASRTLVTE